MKDPMSECVEAVTGCGELSERIGELVERLPPQHQAQATVRLRVMRTLLLDATRLAQELMPTEE